MSISDAAAPAVNSASNKHAASSPASEYNGAIPCDLIKPAKQNRDQIDLERVAELADSIKAEGLLQPIVVRQMPDGLYEIIAGEHRWRATMMLKLPTIAGKIYRSQDALAAARKQGVENFLRVKLTPVEEAKKYRELAELGMKQKEIGALLGKSQPVVANALRLLELPASVQKLISEGKLTMAHGVSLARFARWPKVVEAMAETSVHTQCTSKYLDGEKVPYAHRLNEAGLVAWIQTGRYSIPSYTVPVVMAKLPSFIRVHEQLTICLEPLLWNEERARQDAERAKKQKTVEKREEGKQSKMSPKEKAARQKKVADNKRNREETAVMLAVAKKRLREAKGIDPAAVFVLAQMVIGHRYAGELEEAAKDMGVVLPKGIKGQYGVVDRDKLVALGAEQACKLVVAAVMQREARDAIKYGSAVPDTVTRVAGAKSGGAKAKKK